MFCKSNSIRCPQNLLDKIHVRPEPLRRILVTKLTVPGIVSGDNFLLHLNFINTSFNRYSIVS